MNWTWEEVCCKKLIQKSVTPKGEVRFVKVPSKLMVVLQSAAASSSSSSAAGCGDGGGNDSGNEENVVQNVITKWLPNMEELFQLVPKDLLRQHGHEQGGRTARLADH
ncbi:MAG: hypothetical protein AB1445_11845 [Bacillota bacterium]